MDKNKLKTKWDVLKALREFFEDPSISYKEHEKVWSILTGLRGPDLDVEAYEVKASTTAVIRHRAFGKQVGINICADFNEDHSDFAKYRMKNRDHRGGHFWAHAKQAFDALELSWSYANTDSEADRE